MSILSHIKGAISGFARGGVSGALAGAIGGNNNGMPAAKAARLYGAVGQSSVAQYSASPFVQLASSRLAALPSGLPQMGYTGQIVGGAAQNIANVLTGGSMVNYLAPAAGVAAGNRRYVTKKGTPRRIRRDGQPYAIPRMNPMNPRAARRAIRRIRGARRLLQRIERSLPKAHTRRRAA